MSYNKYLAIIGIAALFSWTGFATVMIKLNPFESPGIALALFFVTLFIALMCTFSVFGFYFRVLLNSGDVSSHHMNVSFRQGLLLSFITCISFVFQLMGVMSWWTGIILIFILLIIEFYSGIRSGR